MYWAYRRQASSQGITINLERGRAWICDDQAPSRAGWSPGQSSTRLGWGQVVRGARSHMGPVGLILNF